MRLRHGDHPRVGVDRHPGQRHDLGARAGPPRRRAAAGSAACRPRRAGLDHRHRSRTGRGGRQTAHRLCGHVGLDPGVQRAVADHPDHVGAPQLEPAVACGQHRGAVGGQPASRDRRTRCGWRRACRSSPSMVVTCPQPRSSGYTATALLVDRGDAAQVDVARVAPQHVPGGRIAAVDLAAVTGHHGSRRPGPARRSWGWPRSTAGAATAGTSRADFSPGHRRRRAG